MMFTEFYKIMVNEVTFVGLTLSSPRQPLKWPLHFRLS